MRSAIRVLAVAILAAAAGVSMADDKIKDKPKAGDKPMVDPPGAPLELTLTGKVTTFTLDTGGLTGAEYKKKLEDASKAGGKLPATPTVDLVAEIKNTSDKPVTVWVSGDPVVLDVVVKGTGAVNAAPLVPMTLEFRVPKAVELAPGKTHQFPVKSLTSGFRGVSKYGYWTEPGDHELVASLRTGVSPVPPGAKDAGEGFGVVTLTSAPLKVKVEAKK